MVHRKPGSGKRSRHITAEGARRMRDELDHLWRVERPRVTQEVADAAALGDRSENAEYIYGKKRLREIDRRLEFLSRRLDELLVVEPTPPPDGSIRFGAWVELESEDGDAAEYRLVGADEFDVAQGLISIDSPVARALLGKNVGDEVIVRRPKGEIEYTVVAVRYPARPDTSK